MQYPSVAKRFPVRPVKGRSTLVLLYLVLVAVLSSCNEEVDLFTTGDAQPVVYCLLNPDANEQFVRIGRSWSPDPNQPGTLPVADSTLWSEPIEIWIEDPGVPDNPSQYLFRRSNQAIRDTGLFSQSGLCLYQASFKPERLKEYRLYVYFPETKRMVYGATRIPARPVVYDPLDLPGRKINLQSETNYTVRWSPPAGAGLYQSLFEITYRQTVGEDQSLGRVMFGNKPVLDLSTGTDVSWILSGNRFLEEVSLQVPVIPGAVREVVNVRFLFYCGGEELALQASPELLSSTSLLLLNPFTNLVNGTGIFSSIQTVPVNNLELSNTTLKELATGTVTGHLGFKNILDGGDEP